MYRNTESSVFFFLEKMERRLKKEEYCQIYQEFSYLEELSQIQWSVSKKQNNGRAYEIKIGDEENPLDYCFEFDTIKKI